MVLRSAGCSIEVTSDDVADDDNAASKLEDIQLEHQSVSLLRSSFDHSTNRCQQNITDYPLIAKAKSSHAFRQSLVAFFDTLIQVMHGTGIFYREKPLIENIDVWISSLSSSTLRPFRHTATLVALTMTTAMCRVANHDIDLVAKVQRQLEAEKKKRGANKDRLADFQQRVKTNEDNKEFIELRINRFFEAVYTHRYRDVDPKIRIECAEAMGTWMLTLESVFFDGSYLRYMGWMLSDIHGPMRLEVVKQLQKLMKDLNAGGMRHFVERFRPRMIEMAIRDSEPGVRAAAVELMDSIRQAGMLEPDDIDTIGKLIFDSEPKVRKAIVGFFAENINDLYDQKVEELGGEEAIEDLLTVDDEEDYDTPRAGWIKLKCLLENLLSYDTQDQDEIPSQIDGDFLDVSGSDSRFTLAAEALYEKVPVLKDWQVLAGYLLYDHTSGASVNDIEKAIRASFKPDEKEELVLLEILNAVVKVNLAQIDESVKEKGKGRITKAEATEARENTARRLADLIPRLLKKYGADPRTVRVVLRLEHVLDLGVFQELRQDTTVYAQMLDDICAQFNGHADKSVLAEAVAALLHARGNEELEEIADSKILSLWEDTANSLRKINKAGEVSVRGKLPEKILTELSHNLARLEQLSTISSSVEVLEDATSKGDGPLPIIILLDIIARGVFEEAGDEALDALEDEVVLSAMKSAMFYFMWKVRALTDALEIEDEIANLDVDHLKEWQDSFIINLTAAFSSRSTLDPVRLVGAGTILDIHTLFTTLRSSDSQAAGSKENGSPYYLTLIRHIQPEVLGELVSIFDALEKQFAKRAKKKLAEPSDDEDPEDFDDEPEDDEEDVTDSERQAETLAAEKDLCELAGKLVLAILGQVIDASGPLKGKLRARLQRNRQRLGPNFKDVVSYLDEPKSKAKKGHKSKAQQAAAETKQRAAKSKELVEEEDEEDDPFADVEPDEGTVEDLRRRELLDEELDGSVDGDGGAGDVEEEDEDDIMGD